MTNKPIAKQNNRCRVSLSAAVCDLFFVYW